MLYMASGYSNHTSFIQFGGEHFNSTFPNDVVVVCHDSSVGIATCHGLDGLGIESLWGRDFTHPP